MDFDFTEIFNSIDNLTIERISNKSGSVSVWIWEYKTANSLENYGCFFDSPELALKNFIEIVLRHVK